MTQKAQTRVFNLLEFGTYPFLCLMVMLGVAYLVGLMPTSGRDSQLDSEIEGLIETELPLGVSTSQVKSWLVTKKVNGIDYSNTDLDYDSSVVDSQFKPSQLSGIISVGLDTSHFFLFTNFTHITFFFDKKGRLIGHSLERGSIGL